jgi:hypothetical protein
MKTTITPHIAEIQNYETDIFLKPKRKNKRKKPIEIKPLPPATERINTLLISYIIELNKKRRKK